MRTRAQRQDGIALPVAIMVLALGLLLTSFALIAANRSNRQTNQDSGEKGALQAADAGLNLTRSRLNLVASLSTARPCIALNLNSPTDAVSLTASANFNGLGLTSSGLCPPVTDTYGNGAVSNCTIATYNPSGGLISGLVSSVFGTLFGVNRTIVCAGTYRGVTRKVAADVVLGSTTTPIFGTYAVASLNDVSLTNGGDRYSSLRSNGAITLSGGNGIGIGSNSSTAVAPTCAGSTGGDATPGPGKTVTLLNNSVVCGSRTAAASTFSLAYDSASARATNDDARLAGCAPLPTGLVDYCPSLYGGWSYADRRLTTSYDPFNLLGQKLPAVTAGGGVYYLCSLTMQGGSHVKFTSAVTIVIDKAACANPNASDAGTFTKTGNADFISATGKASGIQVYVVGGGAVSLGAVTPDNNLTTARAPFTVYAPDSTVTLAGGGITMVGAIAAKSVVATAGSNVVATDDSVVGIGGAGAGTWSTSRFRECVTATPSGALDGCDPPS